MEVIVSVVVEQLGNILRKEAGLLIGVEKEVKKLHSKFKAIQAVLVKAGNKQLTDETIRDWLGKIKDMAYEVEDILDEWRTNALISQREKDDVGNQRKVRSQYLFFPCLCFKQVKFRHETGHRIREITRRLDEISKEKTAFRFNEDVKIDEVELMPKMKARETGSLIDESMIFGRDRVKEIIINELISDNNGEQKSVSITSIVGMGRLGKTTLAQLVYKTLWEKLRVPLIGAAQGSKILITTRSRKAAEVMETAHFHDLEHLSHSDCWNLFKSIAFKGAEDEEFQELTEVGEEIVGRCKGLPLAVRAKADIEVDHLEEIGEIYFDDLLARSLFQDAEKDGDGNIYRCKMHDLVHDLATRVTDGDYRHMKNEDSPPTNCHHLSFLLNHDVSSIPSLLCEATRLRTLLMLSKSMLQWGERSEIKAIPYSLFKHLGFLRALDVSNTSLESLSGSTSELKHLRYLNLSRSMIKELPESVTDLYNLQTLRLNSCRILYMLPSGMSKMVQLGHLEIEWTGNLTFLPNGLGNLTTLRTLCKFPVSDENGGCKIGELKNLNLLRGGLRIGNLERVLNVNEAREAQLNMKSYLL
ncbi:hypothetical protein MRB53_006629 [Persea americana]|uniref:Uncharacterized protein n=1 Tax=Persea americana TaxID=3435 RepID=A0ACC2MGY4_PERAE|nr:hypothetical protein MRB53_006629 [Persea americana]